MRLTRTGERNDNDNDNDNELYPLPSLLSPSPKSLLRHLTNIYWQGNLSHPINSLVPFRSGCMMVEVYVEVLRVRKGGACCT